MAGSMQPNHRKALMRFGDSSLPPLYLDPILDFLEARQVLPESKIHEIRRLPNGRLDLMRSLTKHGAVAFDQFFLSLVHAQQVHLADSLRSLVSPSVIASLENNGTEQRASSSIEEFERMEIVEDRGRKPTFASDGKPSFSSLDLRDIEQKLASYEAQKGERVYQFTSPRGHALIISNERFRSFAQRTGTKADVIALKNLFMTKLGYEAAVLEDLTSKELHRSVKAFASSTKHSFTSSAIVCILTHGEHDVLYGVDGEAVDTHDLLAYFNTHNAPHLAGKPKIILLQACRGKRYDTGYEEETDSGRPPLFLQCLGRGGGPVTRSKIPAEADILVAYATPPHYVAEKRSHDSDLLSILTQVNAKVAETYKAKEEEYKQISEFSSKLTKKFFFFPPSE